MDLGVLPGNPGLASLDDYVKAARPAVSRMLGLDMPQRRINSAFAAMNGQSPMMDFNQSFGMSPFNSPADKAAFLSRYMQQPAAVPAPQAEDTSTPPAEDGYYGGSPENNPNLRPMGSRYPWASLPFSGLLNALSDMGGQPGAGLIPKFVNLIGRSNS